MRVNLLRVYLTFRLASTIALPFLGRSFFLSNLVRRFILPKTRTSSFGNATGRDLRACACFDEFAQNALKRWFAGEMFASHKKSGSLNPFSVINLRSKVKYY